VQIAERCGASCMAGGGAVAADWDRQLKSKHNHCRLVP
jgi:hypothetical protein